MISFERLSAVDTSSLRTEDCIVRGVWTMHGASAVDTFDSESCPPYQHSFNLTLAGRAVGCCYWENSHPLPPDPVWIGADARSVRTESIPFRVSLLDAVFANFDLPADDKHALLGAPREKSEMRAELIVSEIAALIARRSLKTPRIAMVGAVGRVAAALRRHGLPVQCVDMNPNVISKNAGDAQVLDQSHTAAVLKSSNIALLSGMTVANSTLEGLLHLCLEDRISTIVYGQTGAHFGPFYRNWGIDVAIMEHFPFYTLPGVSEVRVYRRP